MTEKQHKYVKAIQGHDRKGLKTLWGQISNSQVDPTEWPSGRALEYLILQAFHLDGADVVWPAKVWDERLNIEENDGIIYYKHWSCIVECKDTNSELNYEPIAKLRSKLMRRPLPTIACIFSKKGYTAECMQLCRYNAPQTILLWQPHEITEDLGKKGKFCSTLISKYRNFVEEGLQKN